jgi:hypothetical protein
MTERLDVKEVKSSIHRWIVVGRHRVVRVVRAPPRKGGMRVQRRERMFRMQCRLLDGGRPVGGWVNRRGEKEIGAASVAWRL